MCIHKNTCRVWCAVAFLALAVSLRFFAFAWYPSLVSLELQWPGSSGRLGVQPLPGVDPDGVVELTADVHRRDAVVEAFKVSYSQNVILFPN